jgi:hypothetical protein
MCRVDRKLSATRAAVRISLFKRRWAGKIETQLLPVLLPH